MRLAFALLLLLPTTQDPSQEEKEFDELEGRYERVSKISDPNTLLEEGASLMLAIQEFRARRPDGTRALAALELASNLQISMGKKCLHADQTSKAEGMFEGAVGTARLLVERVAKMQDENRDPGREQELERFRVYSELQVIAATYHVLLAISQDEKRDPELRARVDKMEEEFRAFMINYDTWIWALEGAVYMGRAVELVARRIGASNFIEAARAWDKVCDLIAKGRNLMASKQWKGDPFVAELSLKSAYYEILARQAYAAMLKEAGAPHERQLFKALDLAEAVFFAYPSAALTAYGRQIQAETDRIQKSLRPK
jgi:hypothetical protein